MSPRSQTPAPTTGSQPLDSWKEIASYLGRSVRTVQRWEKEEQLPVHRHEHLSKGTVFAYRHELDAWRAKRVLPPEISDEVPAAGGSRRMLLYLGGMSLGALLLVGGVWSFLRLSSGAVAASLPSARSFPLAAGAGVEEQVALSPDGLRAVYLKRGIGGCGRLIPVVQTVAPHQLLPLPQPCEDHFAPQWSPDGESIAYGRITPGPVLRVYRRKLGQPWGEEQEIARLRDPDAGRTVGRRWGSWAPDGKRLLVSDRDSLQDPYRLEFINLRDQSRQVLTAPPSTIVGDRLGFVSPDGRSVAILRDDSGLEHDIYVVPVEGGQPRRVTFDRQSVWGIAWTPDSREIVFSSRRQSAVHTLWRIPVDKPVRQEPQRIAGVMDESVWPAVAQVSTMPGMRIAYQSAQQIVNLHRIQFEANSATIRPSSLVCPSNLFDWHAQYSPDGTQVAFSSTRNGSSNIWICKPDSDQAQVVTSFSGTYTDSPRWSPDGTRLVYTSRLGESREVFETDLQTGQSRPVTKHPADDGRASYSRDGRWIYFRSNRSGRNEIWKVPADRYATGNAPAAQVTRTGAMEGFESPDGRLLYFTKDQPQLGVWSIPLEGDATETHVTDGVQDTRWAVTQKGIFYLSPQRPFQVMLFRFDKRTVERVHTVDGPGGIWAGFSASWDGSAIVWPQAVRDSSDLLILDGVR